MFTFKVEQVNNALVSGVTGKGLMVDSGATKHIVMDIRKLEDFDQSFKPQSHILHFINNKGRIVDMLLMEVPYMPSFSQDIFSVKAATAHGKAVIFKEGQNRLIHKNGTAFDSHTCDRLFYLRTDTNKVDECNVL